VSYKKQKAGFNFKKKIMKITIFGITFSAVKKQKSYIKPTHEGLRRSGRSTRLMDNYIQVLFEKGEVIVLDHHPLRDSSRHLYERVLKRLYKEHGLDDKYLTLDKSKFQIRIKR
jgi:hypothetical protein